MARGPDSPVARSDVGTFVACYTDRGYLRCRERDAFVHRVHSNRAATAWPSTASSTAQSSPRCRSHLSFPASASASISADSRCAPNSRTKRYYRLLTDFAGHVCSLCGARASGWMDGISYGICSMARFPGGFLLSAVSALMRNRAHTVPRALGSPHAPIRTWAGAFRSGRLRRGGALRVGIQTGAGCGGLTRYAPVVLPWR